MSRGAPFVSVHDEHDMPTQPSSDKYSIFLNLLQDLTGAILSMVHGMSFNNNVLNSLISRICRINFSDVLIGYVCVESSIGMCTYVSIYIYIIVWFGVKKNDER
jgi:hypothetical protein